MNLKQAAAQKLHERAREFRGRFLNHLAVIERDIALLLTMHFCREDAAAQQLFFDEIACKFSLEWKKELLVKILKADYPAFWANCGSSFRELSQLQAFRNKLAHSVVDVSDEALRRPLEQGVGFVQWKSGEPVTEEAMADWCARASTVLSALSSVRQLFPYRTG